MRPIVLLTIALFISFAGCGGHGSTDNGRAWSTVDSWYSPAPWMESRADAHPVSCVEVKPSASPEAERVLSDNACVAITAADANRFLQHPLTVAPPLSLYLVRGVYLNRGTGAFSVTSNGVDLFVFHGSLGRSAVPMQRQPLIVALPSEPSKIYVSASMAQ